MWNFGEAELLRVNLYVEPWETWTFKSGTVMWNSGEPELLRMEPVCGTLEDLNVCENF